MTGRLVLSRSPGRVGGRGDRIGPVVPFRVYRGKRERGEGGDASVP